MILIISKILFKKKEKTELRYGPSGMDEYEVQVPFICGWILDFFAYIKGRLGYEPFKSKELNVECFEVLCKQMLIVPFTIDDLVHKKTYLMKYKVGFVGCEQNEKNEVYPVQGWFVSPSTKEERESDI